MIKPIQAATAMHLEKAFAPALKIPAVIQDKKAKKKGNAHAHPLCHFHSYP